MVVGMWPMAVLRGREQLWATLVVLFAGIATNVVANLFIDGYADGVYAAAVSFAAFLGWIVQYKNENGRIEFRFRVATHLVYFYCGELRTTLTRFSCRNIARRHHEPVDPAR